MKILVIISMLAYMLICGNEFWKCYKNRDFKFFLFWYFNIVIFSILLSWRINI